MKIKSIILIFSFSVLAFTSCQTKSNSSAIGKWSFNTLQGAYAELWMDCEFLLTVKSDTRKPYVFNYRHSGDTIILYEQGPQGEKEWEISRFQIVEQNDNLIKILQDSIHNDLHLISNEVGTIKNTQTYKDSVLLDFDSRAQSEQ